ncbi:hypothetical protein, partial [Streptomyces sp. NPDC060188]
TGGSLVEPSEPSPGPLAADAESAGDGGSPFIVALALGACLAGAALVLGLRARAVRRGARTDGRGEDSR